MPLTEVNLSKKVNVYPLCQRPEPQGKAKSDGQGVLLLSIPLQSLI